MTAVTHGRPAGRYGIDAPWVPVLWAGLALLYVALAVGAAANGVPAWGVALYLVGTAFFGAGCACYLHASLRGKFAVWDELLLDAPDVRRAVDLGCGRGAIAIMVALRRPGARVTGVDLWRSIDQSGNTPAAAERNAAENGVADRLELVTADMTRLPLADAAADLVTADLSIHNIRSRSGREQAVREAWRVLAPGGTLLIADIRRVPEYRAVLTALGTAVDRRSAGVRMWWSGPWMRTAVLRAQKPRSGA